MIYTDLGSSYVFADLQYFSCTPSKFSSMPWKCPILIILQVNKLYTVRNFFFQNKIIQMFRLFWLGYFGVFIFQVIAVIFYC